MNERDIELALKASDSKTGWLDRQKFADLVRADEREACADIAENWNSNGSPRVGVAKAIRARGNT